MSDGRGLVDENVSSQYDELPKEILPVAFFGRPAETTETKVSNARTRSTPMSFDRAAILIPPPFPVRD